MKNKDVINAAESVKFNQLEKALVQRLRVARASNIPVNCQLLREKGIELAQTFEIENFFASQGWIEKLKNRHVLAMHIVSGESASVNEDKVEQWLSDLPTLFKDYAL